VRRVAVHVERLVLRGVDAGDGQAVAAGLRAELSRLLADPRVAAQWSARREVRHLRLPGIRVGGGAGWQGELGGAVAQAVGKAVGR
jgi:hypothetical protein